MILSGSEIKAQLGRSINITPYSDDQLNPNSYNLTLHDELLVYEEIVLDMKRPSRFRRITIPEDGLILQPNQLYLGRTIEHGRETPLCGLYLSMLRAMGCAVAEFGDASAPLPIA